MRAKRKNGSVLILVLWIIAVLSVMVLSFAYEARQQAGNDLYVRERNRVNRIVDSGRQLAEAVLLDYTSAPEPELRGGLPDWEEAFEKDRWVVQKYELKTTDKCKIGPLRLEEDDEDDEDAANAVALIVEIEGESAESKIDINSLNESDDKNAVSRWQTILQDSGIDEELEVEVEDANRSGKTKHNLMNLLIASWFDWRDDDTTVSRGPIAENEPQEDDGAEYEWYKERYEEDEIPEKDRRYPPDEKGGPIKKLEELAFVRGFRDFPSVLTGGLLYPEEKESEENPRFTGILSRFKTTGGYKIQLNDNTTAEDLKTIPGIFPDDPDDSSMVDDSEELVSAILLALKTMPEDRDVDESRTWWPFRDAADLNQRIEDCGCSVEVPQEVLDYIEFPSSDGTVSKTKTQAQKSSDGKDEESDAKIFKIKITGVSMGMSYTVSARCFIDSDKIRYIEWQEDPGI